MSGPVEFYKHMHRIVRQVRSPFASRALYDQNRLPQHESIFFRLNSMNVRGYMVPVPTDSWRTGIVYQ